MYEGLLRNFVCEIILKPDDEWFESTFFRSSIYDKWTRISTDLDGLTTQELFFLFEPTKTSFCGLSVQIRGNPCPDVIGAASDKKIVAEIGRFLPLG